VLPFSTTQALSHISMITTAPVLGLILILTSVLRHGTRRPWLLGTLMGLLVAVQFYTLTEVLVSSTLALAICAVVALFVARPALRAALGKVPKPFWVATVVTTAVLLLPGAYAMFFGPHRVLTSVQPPNLYVTDLINLVLPTHAFLVSNPGGDLANLFTGNFAEDNGYLGIPAILLALWAVRRLWPRSAVRVLAWSGVIVTVLSLGRNLHLFGWASPLPLPWLLFDQLPFVKDLLPARLMLFAELALLAVCLLAIEDWLRAGRPQGRKPLWLLGLLVVTWLPTFPFPNTALPQASSALRPGTTVYQSLKGQPTYVLTVAFPEEMQALQQSGYAFPVANVYGHNDNSDARNAQLHGVQMLLYPGLGPQVYQTIVVYDLMRLNVRRLLFLPRSSRASTAIPQQALQTLNATLGPPIAASQSGAIVWNVPPHPLSVPAP